MLALMMASPVITFLLLAQRHDVPVTTASATALIDRRRSRSLRQFPAGTAQFFKLGAADAHRRFLDLPFVVCGGLVFGGGVVEPATGCRIFADRAHADQEGRPSHGSIACSVAWNCNDDWD